MLESAAVAKEFSPKLGTSALRETLANTCQAGSTSHSRPTFGLQMSKVRLPGLVAVRQEAVAPVALACRNCVPATSATFGRKKNEFSA